MSEVEEEPTCGRGLAQTGVVPAGLAALAEGLAQNLEVHVRALDLADAAAAREREVYESITGRLRSAAADLRTAAEEMESARDLPVAAHDLAAMNLPDVVDAFERYVAAAADVRRLLDAHHPENEAMLEAMREEADSSPGGTGGSNR